MRAVLTLVVLSLPALAFLSPPAVAARESAWNYSFQMGIGEYLTGEWDSPTGGALNISCRAADGSVSIMPQIKGTAAPANGEFTLAASSRAGTKTFRFKTDANGSARIAKSNDRYFSQLWAELRARDIVTIRYPDGRSSVQSLDGAAKTLPAKPCGQ